MTREEMEAEISASVIKKIAEVAHAVGWQAGEPASELAGQIVSVLAGHPEWIERFMSGKGDMFVDGFFDVANGSLSYRAINGKIMTPAQYRATKGVHDH